MVCAGCVVGAGEGLTGRGARVIRVVVGIQVDLTSHTSQDSSSQS